MRAVLAQKAGGPEVLGTELVTSPTRVGSEVLVRVLAAGVNPVDAKTRAGVGVAAGLPGWPTILGYDFSGVVVESPYRSFGLQPGDEVFGMTAFPHQGGSYAEYVSVPALNVARKPSVLSHTEAAAVPLAALTAWGATVDVAKAHEGQRVLVHAGAGGVGHLAVQFAAYFGADVTTTASAANADWLLSLGAREVIDYTTTRFDDILDDFDVVIDCVGEAKSSTATRSIPVLRQGGLLVSLPGDGIDAIVATAEAAGRRATGYWVIPDASTLSVIARLITSGDVKIAADHVFDLEQAADAHRLVESGHVRGKVVLKISDY
ncbi:NADPH:quinone reductase [Amnibacterium flavum]|uniref:NADPH:quinone reductase n=2 Tax=Amnibacterium flavum TaxID=2173173 RepID=A0A2V1HZA8_9MICO|nr:NADP-dependent oxidoreductase [Amnibacterium flavum]PVZ96347.1 NADPH:quinone reductase [Amnibacterium flavum]